MRATKSAVSVCILITCAFLGLLVSTTRHSASLEYTTSKLKSRLGLIQKTAKGLLNGESEIKLYSTRETDSFLSIFAYRPDVKGVYTETTDIGIDGLVTMTKMPNLKIVSFSGDLITDEMLPTLTNCNSLEELSLKFTRVSASGIHSLSQLNHLRTLRIDAKWAGDEARKAMNAIQELKNLSHLELGTWADAQIVRELNDALPACEIIKID